MNNILIDGETAAGDVVIPYGVTSIGAYAFDFSNITSVTIPASVMSIKTGAFSECDGLTTVAIPDSVTSIEEYVFNNCISLTTAEIPDSVTNIGDYAFFNCNSLTTVAISNNLTNIGKSAFSFCDSLTSVTIPESVTSMGYLAFSSCERLTSLTVNNQNCKFSDSSDAISDTATIYGYSGSTAEEYARKYNRTFVSLDDSTVHTGDINSDNKTDISDATIVLNIYACSAAEMDMSKYTEEQLTAADIDGDGKISTSDATYILTYYAQNAAGMNPSWEDILKK